MKIVHLCVYSSLLEHKKTTLRSFLYHTGKYSLVIVGTGIPNQVAKFELVHQVPHEILALT